jgi:hypothetical protein
LASKGSVATRGIAGERLAREGRRRVGDDTSAGTPCRSSSPDFAIRTDWAALTGQSMSRLTSAGPPPARGTACLCSVRLA